MDSLDSIGSLEMLNSLEQNDLDEVFWDSLMKKMDADADAPPVVFDNQLYDHTPPPEAPTLTLADIEKQLREGMVVLSNESLKVIHENLDTMSDELIQKLPHAYIHENRTNKDYSYETMLMLKNTVAGLKKNGIELSLRQLLKANKVLVEAPFKCYAMNKKGPKKGKRCGKYRRNGKYQCTCHDKHEVMNDTKLYMQDVDIHE